VRASSAPFADPVEAGVARVRPPGLAALHDTGHHGRARRLGQAVRLLVLHDLAVGATQREVEKLDRIGQRGVGHPLETGRHRLRNDLRGDLAAQMAAHAVGHQHQQTVAGEAIPHPVLVDARAPIAVS
jgi:hypothetical protein